MSGLSVALSNLVSNVPAVLLFKRHAEIDVSNGVVFCDRDCMGEKRLAVLPETKLVFRGKQIRGEDQRSDH